MLVGVDISCCHLRCYRKLPLIMTNHFPTHNTVTRTQTLANTEHKKKTTPTKQKQIKRELATDIVKNKRQQFLK